MRKLLPMAAVLCLVAAGCAKESTWNTGQKAREYLTMYMDKYYPNVAPDENGLYILEEQEGDGKLWDPDSTHIYAEYTIRTLDGSISSSTDVDIAKQLGTYDSSNYYGPRFMAQGSGSSFVGVDMLLEGMREGGRRKAVIPAWLLNTSRLSSLEAYINACTTESHLVYDITYHGQTGNIDHFEIDSLERYVLNEFGVDREGSTTFVENGVEGTFYFFSDTTEFAGTRHFPADTTLKIRYTGYLLNGQAFDTTEERIAKDHNIFYVSGKSYQPVSVTMASKYSDIKMGSSTLISGFQGGLSMMRFVGQTATFLFTSTLGYAGTGSGSAIPPYSPLMFEVEIVKE